MNTIDTLSKPVPIALRLAAVRTCLLVGIPPVESLQVEQRVIEERIASLRGGALGTNLDDLTGEIFAVMARQEKLRRYLRATQAAPDLDEILRDIEAGENKPVMEA